MTQPPGSEAMPIEPVATVEKSAIDARETESDDEAARYQHARQMIVDAIEAHVGREGQHLLARLEQTANIVDLHELLPDFAKALVRHVGLEPATPIVSSLERLISGT
jgi:hypothetical protein